ncbi:MAG: Fibronectin type protein [Belnapia sp.]|nr:Fibronectin type protein [Belnapia sp.]
MRRLVLLLILLFLGPAPGHAQPAAPNPPAALPESEAPRSSIRPPTPLAAPTPPEALRPAPVAPIPVPDCNVRPQPQPVLPSRAPILLTVNPATTWQPRGGEVLVKLAGDRADIAYFSVRACFRWAQGEAWSFAPATVQIRPSDLDGTANLGIVVPYLRDAPETIVQRVKASGTLRSDGFGMVPDTDLRIIVATDRGIIADNLYSVGITSVWWGLIISLLTTGIGLWVLYILARQRNVAGYGLLKLVVNRDGKASLTGFQTLLWSVVISFCSVYVMALSGNLINITTGTLVLLGIAGVSTVTAAFQAPGNGRAAAEAAVPEAAKAAVAALPDSQAVRDAVQQLGQQVAAGNAPAGMAMLQAAVGNALREPAVGAVMANAARGAAIQALAGAPAGAVQPRFADFIAPTDNSPGVDITRVQMLFFTVIAAFFVLLKVLNTYLIPEIPEGYLLLIGISNSVYIGGRFGTAKQ